MTWFLSGIILIHFLIMGFMLKVGLRVQRRQARWAPKGPVPEGGVSVILPIKGLDPGAAAHYRHWLSQEFHQPYEVIFSLQDPADPVLPVLRSLLAEFPERPTRLLINPVRPGLNGKSSNLAHGIEAARYPYLVMADSDIDPPCNLLQQLLPPLADPGVGQVACMPVVRSPRNLWGGLNAVALNITLSLHWGFAIESGKNEIAPGACFAVRKSDLERIGGIAAFGGFITEDAEMTRQLLAHGLRLVVGPTVTLEQGEGSWPAYFGLASRGALMTKHVFDLPQRLAMLFSLLTPILILVGATAAGHSTLILVSLAGLLARTLLVAVLQRVSDPPHWAYGLSYPLMELTFTLALVRVLFTNTVAWRGIRYRVRQGGRLEVLTGAE